MKWRGLEAPRIAVSTRLWLRTANAMGSDDKAVSERARSESFVQFALEVTPFRTSSPNYESIGPTTRFSVWVDQGNNKNRSEEMTTTDQSAIVSPRKRALVR